MPKVLQDLRLVENLQAGPYYHILKFQAPLPLPEILPGQFVEIQAPNHMRTFLRRPFSIHDVDKEQRTISLLIKKVGEGTKALASSSAGTMMSTIYPLGNGFSIPTAKKVILTGGGCGIAPMLFLGKVLKDKGNQVEIALGGRTRDDIVETELFASLGNLHLATEDGSLGIKGFVTELPVISALSSDVEIIYSCGPEPMLRAVSLIAQKAGVICEVSLENTMACGIGACLCCVVPTTQGNQCVCTAGPVFNVKDLTGWDVASEIGETCPVL